MTATVLGLMHVTTAALADSGRPTSDITGGAPTTAYPAVVGLLSEGTPRCTGTLVTRRVVLTAAHCVPPTPQARDVYIGAGLDVDAGTVIAVAETRRHPRYDPDTMSNDIALLYLEHEAPVAPISMFAGLWDDSFIGRPIHVVGFGAPAAFYGGTHLKRDGLATIAEFTPSDLTLIAAPAQTCTGDSGGPAFLTIDGTDFLVGVTSFGDSGCREYGVDTRVDQYVGSFVGPFVASRSRTDRTDGELCQTDDQCGRGRCELASRGAAIKYCTRSCTTDAGCPTEMPCDIGRSICAYLDEGPAANRAPCDGDRDCASGTCSMFSQRERNVCATWCSPSDSESCPADEICRENLDDRGTYVCGPMTPMVAGCSTSEGGDGTTFVAVVVCLLALGPFRFRRRRLRCC